MLRPVYVLRTCYHKFYFLFTDLASAERLGANMGYHWDNKRHQLFAVGASVWDLQFYGAVALVESPAHRDLAAVNCTRIGLKGEEPFLHF